MDLALEMQEIPKCACSVQMHYLFEVSLYLVLIVWMSATTLHRKQSMPRKSKEDSMSQVHNWCVCSARWPYSWNLAMPRQHSSAPMNEDLECLWYI